MKELKKIILGLLAGVLAVVLSSFTNAHKSTAKTIRNAKGQIVSVQTAYYRIPAFASTAEDTDPSHYIFSDTPDADCVSGTSCICHSEWTTDSAPSTGDSPSILGTPTFVQGDWALGIYNGQ